jgi:GrpB-like predicted nucleotidyltransferase (UPF0157 family)
MRHDFSDVTSENEAERLGKLYPIKLEEHNPNWKAYYEEEKAFLQEVFSDTVLRISHIGSTAVPGLIAKPTIDILLEIKEDIDIAKITGIMVDKGYVVNTPPIDIITYLKGYGPNGFVGQAFHIHVRRSGDWDALYFRDYLIAHPVSAKQYEALKLRLKNEYGFDRDGYSAAKGEFIERITALARTEFKDKYKPIVE